MISIESFRLVARSLPEAMLLVAEDGIILSVNPAAKEMLEGVEGVGVDRELEGLPLGEIVEDGPERISALLSNWARSREILPGSLRLRGRKGGAMEHRVEGALLALRAEGQPAALLLRFLPKEKAQRAFTELNERLGELSASRTQILERDQRLRLQHEQILELTAPIIDIWEGGLLLALAGSFDAEQVTGLTERVLVRITTVRARWLIVDVTGVDGADARVADHLTHLAGAVGLVGCQCVLTGLSPAFARVVVEQGLALDRVKVMQSLHEGLRACISRELRVNGHARSSLGTR